MKTFISDVDGCLLDVNTEFAKIWTDLIGTKVYPTDFVHWNYGQALGVASELVDTFWGRVWHEAIPKPYPGAAKFIKHVKKYGYKFVLLTSRPKGPARENLYKSLDPLYDCEVDDVLVCDQSAGERKSTYINDSGKDTPEFFLEDHVTNAVDAKVHCPQLKEVFLLDRPWNQSRDLAGYRRVIDYSQIMQYLY